MCKLSFLNPVPIKDKIRLGRNLDGGYIVYNKLLFDTDILLTYGVGYDVSFEEHFNRITNKKVLMFDPTLFGAYLIDFKLLGRLLLSFRFKKTVLYLSDVWGLWRKKKTLASKGILFFNEGIDVCSKEKYDTLSGHIERFRLQDKLILLKMDIEGNEYKIFNNEDVYSGLKNVTQLVIEFHDIDTKLREVESIFKKLTKEFEVIHIHGNNFCEPFILYDLLNGEGGDILVPRTLEVSFARKDKICVKDILSRHESYPTDLDFPCHPGKPDIPLMFI